MPIFARVINQSAEYTMTTKQSTQAGRKREATRPARKTPSSIALSEDERRDLNEYAALTGNPYPTTALVALGIQAVRERLATLRRSAA